MSDINARKANFDQAIEEYDEKALTKSLDFTAHRYVTIERDGYTDNRYVKGHRTLRQACDYLARVQEEGEPFVPEHVLDLDSGELHDLDVLAFVAPKSINAVAVMMPQSAAAYVYEVISSDTVHRKRSVESGRAWKAAMLAFERVTERGH